MNRRNGRSAHLRLIGIGVVSLLAGATAAMAADLAKEISTAAQHAELAATATDVKMVKVHLHHTINCLVGPNSDSFDAKQLDPCKDFGDGAIPETTDAAKKKSLEGALAKAKSGLAADDLAAAQAIAAQAETLIKAAM